MIDNGSNYVLTNKSNKLTTHYDVTQRAQNDMTRKKMTLETLIWDGEGTTEVCFHSNHS